MNQTTNGKKLLIVDDSKVSRMVIRARVKVVHPEWEIIEAATGDEGIQIALDQKPDFCTMDINMPGILGTDAAEQILRQIPDLRLVIFSANIQEAFQERTKNMGALFVAKPVTEKSIAEALRYFTESV